MQGMIDVLNLKKLIFISTEFCYTSMSFIFHRVLIPEFCRTKTKAFNLAKEQVKLVKKVWGHAGSMINPVVDTAKISK